MPTLPMRHARWFGAAAFITTACGGSPAKTAESAPTPATATAAPAASREPAGMALPPGVTPDMIAQGERIFNTQSCQRCHGLNGVGGVRAPNLTDDTWIHIDGSYGAIVSLVTTGFTKDQQKDPKYQFAMNPRGGTQLTDEQIKAVAAYVWSLSHHR